MSIQHNPYQRFEIKTPNGWESFSALQKVTKPSVVEVRFHGIKKPIQCSTKHRFKDSFGSFILAEDLVGGEPIEHELYGQVTVKSVKLILKETELYDVLDVGEDNVFYSDGVVSHNCEFLGSSDTLISVDRLTIMTSKKPIALKKLKYDDVARLEIHTIPEPHHQYVLCADVSDGKDQDFSAITITDITSVPYRVVAKYRSDKIRPILFSEIIYEAAIFYNNAFVLVETNDLGAETAKTLHQDLEYEYIITTSSKGKSGPQVGSGFSKNVEFGLRHNKSSKKQGCSNFKTLLETEKLIVEDFEIYQELTTFVLNNRGSYSAEEGSHDDLVMTLVSFSWLVTQRYFKDLTNTDIYHKLKEDYDERLEEDVPLFGFISTPGSTFYDDDGLVL